MPPFTRAYSRFDLFPDAHTMNDVRDPKCGVQTRRMEVRVWTWTQLKPSFNIMDIIVAEKAEASPFSSSFVVCGVYFICSIDSDVCHTAHFLEESQSGIGYRANGEIMELHTGAFCLRNLAESSHNHSIRGLFVCPNIYTRSCMNLPNKNTTFIGDGTKINL